MLLIRRVSLAVCAVASAVAVVACSAAAPAASQRSPVESMPRMTVAGPTALAPSAAASVPVATGVPSSAAASNEPSAQASGEPRTTPVPGSSLDPDLSDSGIAARVTIENDTRGGRTGTHEILGVADDGSECSQTFEGDEFSAVAWYDDAPAGMIHQFSVSMPIDELPANPGESRRAITDGSVYIDFVSDSGFGTAYGGSVDKGDGSSSIIDVTQTDEWLVFDFTATTWDKINFSGQLICEGMGGAEPI